MKATDLFVKCLENEGVRYVFGLPGEEVLDLLDSLSSSEQITFITCRHEQGAAFMADVYGRVTGTAGVCLGTLGPGATNLITGVADANLDRSPVVGITGQTELANMHKEVHQFIDTAQMFTFITKWNKRITKAYGVIEWKQRVRFGRAFGSSSTNPDFVKLAESFDATGHRIQNAPEFYSILEEALSRGGRHIIDVPVDFEENLRLTKQLGEFICPI